jgi:Leucine-rich repeat (LRR) protein
MAYTIFQVRTCLCKVKFKMSKFNYKRNILWRFDYFWNPYYNHQKRKIIINKLAGLLRFFNFPDEFDQHLIELTNLYLHGNLLEKLPVTITRIQHLSVLEISRNRISDLPVEIGNLGCLITLDLSNNLIESLPDSIGDLTHLQNLILIRNNLKKVPPTIGKLKFLTR